MKSQNTKVIFITDSYPPSIDATSRLNSNIAKKIAEKYEITLLLPTKLFAGAKKKEILFTNEGNIYKRLVPIPFAETKKKTLKVVKFTFYGLACFAYTLLKRNHRNTYIIHSSPPINIPLFAILIATRNLMSRKRRRAIAYIHDLYPEIAEEITKENKLLQMAYKITKRIYSVSYNSFDAVITCSDSISETINVEYDVPRRNIITAWNWSLIEEDEPKLKKRENSLKTKNHSIYSIGNFGILHMPEKTISLIKTIANDKNQAVELYLRGTHAKNLQIIFDNDSNIKICKYMTLEELKMKYQTTLPITFVSLNKESSKYAFPSRIATALSLGSPILFFSDDHTANPISKIIEQQKIGELLDEKEGIKSINKKVVEINCKYEEYSKRCKKYYEEIMGKDKNLNKIMELIESLE